jgi:hypothetical protein
MSSKPLQTLLVTLVLAGPGQVPPAGAQPTVTVTTTELCDFDAFSESGTAEADLAARTLRAEAEGAASAVDSVAAISVDFVAHVSFPATLHVDAPFRGRLQDNAAPRSHYRIEMILDDRDAGVEVTRTTIGADQKPPPFGPTTVVNNPFGAGTLTLDLEGGTEYRLAVRLEVHSNGLASDVDFFNGDRGVGVSCLTITPDLEDTDGDAIFDEWETSGIDVDGGADDLEPNDLGVDVRGMPIVLDPMKKDILVEIDYFDCDQPEGDCDSGDNHSHNPRTDALTAVVDAFANASEVDNPDGTGGVNLWIVRDQALSHQQFCDLDEDCFDALKAANLGPAGTSDAARTARSLIFHYNLWVHLKGPKTNSTGESDGGCDNTSTPRWGDDFVVSLGARSVPNGDLSDQGGTFMHELGHNLGLCHGGQDDTNCKPNYLSVMSYAFQTRGLLPTGAFDYSHEALPPLDETMLDETDGIQDGTLWTWFGPRQDVDGDGNGDWLFGVGNGQVNWNWSFDGSGAPTFQNNVAADVNNLGIRGCQASAGETLAGADDWGNLIFDFRSSRFYPTGHAGADDDEELTSEDIDLIDEATYWLRRNPRFDYAAKLVCGVQGESDVLSLARGAYGTTINILNQGRRDAEFLKHLVLALPPGEQRPGNTYRIALDQLPAGHALAVDCDDVRERLFPDGFPGGYVDGFVTLESDERLEVVGVYTVASVNQAGDIVGGSSIHLERAAGRRRPPEADLAIDKTAEILAGGRTSEIHYTVTVTNHGPGAATEIELGDVLTMEQGDLTNLTVLGASHGSGWNVLAQDTEGAELEAEIAELSEGEVATLEFLVLTVNVVPPATRIRNRAEVESAVLDPSPANDQVTVVTEIPLAP